MPWWLNVSTRRSFRSTEWPIRTRLICLFETCLLAIAYHYENIWKSMSQASRWRRGWSVRIVSSRRRCDCPWGLRFFGLTPNDKEVFLEHIFLLMYYTGFTHTEAYNLPVWQRIWYLDRINQEFKRANEANNPQPNRAAHANTPEQRAMMGLHNPSPPARLRRFT